MFYNKEDATHSPLVPRYETGSTESDRPDLVVARMKHTLNAYAVMK